MIAYVTQPASMTAVIAPGGAGSGSYVLPVATPTVLGGVKIGANIAVTADGTISVAPPVSGGSQTPWLSDIDGGNYTLTNVREIDVNESIWIADAANPASFWCGILNNGGVLDFSRAFEAPGHCMIASNDPTYSLNLGGDLNITGQYRVNGVPLSTGGAVSSVFTRTGAVVAVAGDYTAAQVTNAVDKTGSYPDPAWITSFSWAKLTGVPALVTTFNGRSGGVAPAVGDYTAAMVTNAVSSASSYSDPGWLTALSWSKLTGSPSPAQVAGIQTPWLQDINAATFNLLNLRELVIGQATVPTPADTIYATGTTPSLAFLNSGGSGFRIQTQSAGQTVLQAGTNLTTGTKGTLFIGSMGATVGGYCFNLSTGMAGFNYAGGSPSARLEINDVVNQASGTLRLDCAVAAAADFSAITFSNGTTAATITAGIKGRLVATGHMAFDFLAQSTGQTTLATLPSVLTIQGNGNVGIGTTSPAEALDVTSGGIIVRNYTGTSSANSAKLDYYTGNARLISQGPNTSTNGGLQIITTHSDGTGPLTPILISPVGGIQFLALTSQPIADGSQSASSFQVWVNEAGNALTFRVKYSGGTSKTGTIALA